MMINELNTKVFMKLSFMEKNIYLFVIKNTKMKNRIIKQLNGIKH